MNNDNKKIPIEIPQSMGNNIPVHTKLQIKNETEAKKLKNTNTAGIISNIEE